MTPAEKRKKDDMIFHQLINMPQVQKAKAIVCFISTLVEVDTHRLIHYCWRSGKEVVVPRCIDDNGTMKFFAIRSWEDVEVGKYSLLEPSLKRCREFTDWEGSVCIVPGFCFDLFGYRIGFGKGYYDRFLSKYGENKIGICYNNCVVSKLIHGRYDVAVDYLVTEDQTKKILSQTNQKKRRK